MQKNVCACLARAFLHVDTCMHVCVHRSVCVRADDCACMLACVYACLRKVGSYIKKKDKWPKK